MQNASTPRQPASRSSDQASSTRPWVARLTYANVMSTIAVVLVMAGGTAWAAPKISGATLKNNSVTGKKIKRSTLAGKHLKKRTVGQPKLATGAANARVIASNAVKAAEIATGAVAASEIRDGSITLGDISSTAKSSLNMPNVVMRKGSTVFVTAGTEGEATASCADGEQAIAGGASAISGGGKLEMVSNRPSSAGNASGDIPTGWLVGYHNGAVSDRTITAWVICAQ